MAPAAVRCGRRVVGGLGLLLAVLGLSGCQEPPPAARIDLSRRVDVAPVRPPLADGGAPAGAVPLRVAIASILSPTRTLDDYHDLLAYMARRLGRPVRLVQRSTYAEVNDLLKNHDIDLAFACSGALVEGERSFGMQAIAAPQVRGETVYYSYLIVHRDRAAAALEDLRGTSFAFTDPLSNSGRLAPLYQLAIRGETPERFFKRTVYTYSHDNSIVAVADGLVDAAAVDSLVYDYLRATTPETVAATRVIARWGPYGIPPVAVGPRLDARERATLRDFLLSIHEDPVGREILGRLMIDRFVPAPPAMFDSIRQMEARLRRR